MIVQREVSPHVAQFLNEIPEGDLEALIDDWEEERAFDEEARAAFESDSCTVMPTSHSFFGVQIKRKCWKMIHLVM